MIERPLLPSWITQEQPLYLNRAYQERIIRDFSPRAIFLNIPYSPRYSNLEIAIISTVTAYDLIPRMARERNRMEIRLLKIAELMLSCKFALTDLSYVRRMNMPFELGMLLAFGKDSFIMSAKRYGALRSVSDLNFTDIYYHEGKIKNVVTGLSKWIEQTCSAKQLSKEVLLRRHRTFRKISQAMGEDFNRLRPQQIASLVPMASEELGLIIPGS